MQLHGAVRRLLRRLPQTTGQQVERLPHGVFLLPRHRHGELVGKGRVSPQLPKLDLRVIEPLIILLRRRLDHVVLGRVGLDHSSSRLTAPSGPPDHLRQQIEGALRRPVVIHIQRRVRAEDTHQRHIFKIQSLGHHLRSQQDRHPLLLKLPQDGLVSHGYGVRVHPQQRRAGEDPMQLLLHPLGANADVLELSAAFGADLRRFFGIAAVVAHQPSVGAVVGKVHAATRTFGYIGTLGTQQLAAAAPAVEEQNALLPSRQIFL